MATNNEILVWSYDDMRAVDSARARRLETVGSPQELIEALASAFRYAIDSNKTRFAVDSENNEFVTRRVIVQFPVEPVIYDWFFNSRTGYRAQFWLSPEIGFEFNTKIVAALVRILKFTLPETVTARRIHVAVEQQYREERDAGIAELSRVEVINSLEPGISKIWIGERLYSHPEGRIDHIGLVNLSEAARSKAKLRVSNWSEEGLRAPLPLSENSWLDVKGGFASCTSAPRQIKSHHSRAMAIHRFGWT